MEFEEAWYMIEADGRARIDGGEVTQSISELDPPVPYRPSTPSEDAHQRLGLQYGTELLGGWYLRSVLIGDDGGTSVLDGRRYISRQSEDWPQTITTNGITIEVIARDESTLTYRVIEVPEDGSPALIYRSYR